MTTLRTSILAIFFGAALCGGAAADDDLTGLGIDDPVLAQEIWDEFEAIINPNGAPRGDGDGDDLTAGELMQDAYRADPEATLDLIERMLRAGQNG